MKVLTKSKLMIAGKAIPIWLLVLAIAAVAAGGVAAGHPKKGQVEVMVTQALQIQSVTVGGDYDERFTAISDDNTKFIAAIEANSGDEPTVSITVSNVSAKAANAIMRATYDPTCLTIKEVQPGVLYEPDAWVFSVGAGSTTTPVITFHVWDTVGESTWDEGATKCGVEVSIAQFEPN